MDNVFLVEVKEPLHANPGDWLMIRGREVFGRLQARDVAPMLEQATSHAPTPPPKANGAEKRRANDGKTRYGDIRDEQIIDALVRPTTTHELTRVLNITPNTDAAQYLSHRLTVLMQRGIVIGEKHGKRTFTWRLPS